MHSNRVPLRICLLGEVYPFKGGCSHYNSSLANKLSKCADLRVISFARPFISAHFKGDRKDYSSKSFLNEKALFILDILNPTSWIRTAKKITDFKPDVLLLEWTSWQYSIPYFVMLRRIKKEIACKVCIICHEPIPRLGKKQRLISAPLTKLIFKKVDSVIVHSEQDYESVKKLAPGTSVRKLFHPVFDSLYCNVPKERAKRLIDVTGNVVLFFGYIQESKGLKYLIDAIPHVLKRVPVTLLVVGEFWEKKGKYYDQVKRLNLKSNVRIVARYVSDQELANYFSAADIIVVPYVSATQSGVVNTAYAFNKPVIATKVGGLPEIVQDGGTGYLVEPRDSRQLAKAIVRFYTSDRKKKFDKNLAQIKAKLSFDNLSQKIIDCAMEHKA
jgi:glycosyltransferase involved in cell wall biosynthesis